MADQQHLPRRRSSTFDRASVEGTLNPTRRPRPRQHSSSTAMSQQSHRTRTRTNSGSMYSAATPESAFSDEEPEWEHGEEVKVKRRKKDEPMSPVVVVLYVAAFYLIFQILTRSDELEILSHLPPTSALFSGSSPLAFSGGPNYRADGSSNNYHLPYHLPHLPSPVPAVSGSENGGSVSIFRIILGVVMYPLYLAITLLAIPVPLLLNTLHLVLHILFTILYPVTSTGRLIARTFILGPLAFVGDILSVFYPVYTFVGGVIGLGCVMGLGAGWLGKISMDLLIHGRVSGSKKSSKRNKSGGSSKSRSTKSKSSSSHRKEDRDQDFTHANNSSRQVDASRGKGSVRYPIAVETNAIAQKGSSRVPKWDVSPESGHNDETIVTPRQTASRQIHYDSQRSQFEEPFQRDTRSIARSGGRGHQQHSRYEEDYDPDEDYDQLTHLRGEDGRYDDTTIGKATGRKPQVVATRRRTHMLVEK